MTHGDLIARQLQRLAQHGFRQPRQFDLHTFEIEAAGQVRDRDTQKFLLPERADGVEARLEIRACADPPGQFVAQLRGGAANVCEVGPHERIENFRMADKERGEMATRSEEPEQHAARCRMFFEQCEKRSPRANRRDERGEIHQREVGIGEAADFVDQFGPEAIEQLAAVGARRRLRRALRQQRQMVDALRRATEAKFHKCGDRTVMVASGAPCGLRGSGDLDLVAFATTRQHLAELSRDEFAMIAERRLQSGRRVRRFAEAEPGREHRKAFGLVGQRVGLQTGGDLQLVLRVAQEEVGVAKFLRPIACEIAVSFEPIERVEGHRGTQPRVASAVNQGERLHDEFEFADAAAPKLDIALDQIRRSQFLLDLPLHRAQLPQRVEVEIAPIDEAREFLEQAPAGLDRTRCRPRAQQRRPLPGIAHALVIAERALHRDDERRTASTRPQAHIHAETFGRNYFGQRLADAICNLEPRRIGSSSEQVDQVDVGTEIELFRPELAHREHA